MTEPSFCWLCGKKLAKSRWALRFFVYAKRDYHGAEVTLHKVCAKTFDKKQMGKLITAQPGDTSGKKEGAE